MCRIIKLWSIFTIIMRILTIFFILLVREIYRCVNRSVSWKKGAIIVHVKFSREQKLRTLRYFRILHVQILPAFKNWDIPDLTLRRCDTLKSCPWNLFKFPWVVHWRKICKNHDKKHEAIILKSWTKETALVYIFCFLFYGVSCAKTNLHNKYIYLTLCLADFLNKIIY